MSTEFWTEAFCFAFLDLILIVPFITEKLHLCATNEPTRSSGISGYPVSSRNLALGRAVLRTNEVSRRIRADAGAVRVYGGQTAKSLGF